MRQRASTAIACSSVLQQHAAAEAAMAREAAIACGSSYGALKQTLRFDHLVKLKIELVKFQSNHGMVLVRSC
jgi:hypothetical protein